MSYVILDKLHSLPEQNNNTCLQGLFGRLNESIYIKGLEEDLAIASALSIIPPTSTSGVEGLGTSRALEKLGPPVVIPWCGVCAVTYVTFTQALGGEV